MPIEYQPFSDFRSLVQQIAAPEDLAENLETPFRHWVASALADVQLLIPWYRSFNLQFVTKSGVNEFCNASIFEGPVGKVTQLFAYKPNIDCKKFYYKRVSPAAIDCWMERQRCLCPATDPPANEIYDSPYCNYVIAGESACAVPYLTETEDDCRFKSLDDDDRIFAVGPDYKVYAAPRFPCGYVLLLQWQGINRKWNDNDLVPVDEQLKEVIVSRVEYKIAMKEKDRAAARDYFDAYTMELRTLKFRYHDEQDTEMKRDCSAAIETLMSTFRPLYETPVYDPVP
jgi:hypothetical protein